MKAFDQASCNHQPLRLAAALVPRHLQDRVNRFLLSAANKRAGIHPDHVGICRVRSQLGPRLRQHAHHHLAIHKVLRAAQANEPHLGRNLGRNLGGNFGQSLRSRRHGYVFLYWHKYFSDTELDTETSGGKNASLILTPTPLYHCFVACEWRNGLPLRHEDPCFSRWGTLTPRTSPRCRAKHPDWGPIPPPPC